MRGFSLLVCLWVIAGAVLVSGQDATNQPSKTAETPSTTSPKEGDQKKQEEPKKPATEITVEIPGKLTIKAEGVERPAYTSEYSTEIRSVYLPFKSSKTPAEVTLIRELTFEGEFGSADRPLPIDINEEKLLKSVVVQKSGKDTTVATSVVTRDGKKYLRIAGKGTVVISYDLPGGDLDFTYLVTAQWPDCGSQGPKDCTALVTKALARRITVRNQTLEEWPEKVQVGLQNSAEIAEFKAFAPIPAGGSGVSTVPVENSTVSLALVAVIKDKKGDQKGASDETPLALLLTAKNWPKELTQAAPIQLVVGSGNDLYRAEVESKNFKKLFDPKPAEFELPADPLLTVTCRSEDQCGKTVSGPTKICRKCSKATIQNGMLVASVRRNSCITNKHPNSRSVVVPRQKPPASGPSGGSAAEKKTECVCIASKESVSVPDANDSTETHSLLPNAFETSKEIGDYKKRIDELVELANSIPDAQNKASVIGPLTAIQEAIKVAKAAIDEAEKKRPDAENQFFQLAFAPIGRSGFAFEQNVQDAGKKAQRFVDVPRSAWSNMYCDIVKILERSNSPTEAEPATESAVDRFPTQLEANCCGR